MKIKQLIALFLALALLCSVFVGCSDSSSDDNESGESEDGNEDKPNEAKDSETLIKERIKAFAKAYNDGDMEEAMEHLSAKMRNAMKGLINLLGGIAGGITGVDLDLRDLFSLGIAMAPNDFMNLSIEDVSIDASGTTATARVRMNLMSENAESVYFKMLYENGGWYINDMTDQPSGSFGGNDTENGDSSNGGDIVADEYGFYDLAYTKSAQFIDGYAWVTYANLDGISWKNPPQSKDLAFIDDKGNIYYSIKLETSYAYYDSYNIGKGCGIIYTDNEMHVVNKNGVALSLKKNVEIVSYGYGYAVLYRNESTITEIKHQYAIIDHTGNYVMPFTTVSEEKLDTYRSIEPVGDNLFMCRDSGYGDAIIADVDNNFRYRISNANNFNYQNGELYIQAWYGGDIYIYDVNTDELLYTIQGQFILSPNGNVQSTEAYEVFTGKYAIIRGEEYFNIIDRTTTPFKTTPINKYSASMIESIEMVGDYILTIINGVDGKQYFTVFDTKGNELYAPIEVDAVGASSWYPPMLYADGNVFTRESRIDAAGNITELSWDNTCYHEARNYIIKYDHSTDSYSYCKLDGTPLFTLKAPK